MLTLRPTKLFAQRLRLQLPPVPPPVSRRMADWCVHGFTEARHRYLLFCHTVSLFPIVLNAQGVRDETTLIDRFIAGIKLVMEGTEQEFVYHSWIRPELGEVQFAPIPDKSILSSVNELIMMSRYGMEKSPVELSQWLAETPMKAFGYQSPMRVFRSLRPPASQP